MGYRFVKSVEMLITKDLAKSISDLPAIDRERTLKTARLGQLRVAVETGQATVFRWAIARVGNEEFRVNGQHSSHLLSNGVAIPPGTKAIVEYYECDSKDDLVSLWSTFDPSVSVRNSSEQLQAFVSTAPLLSDVAIKSLRVAVSALVIEKFGFGYVNKITSQQRHSVLAGNEDFILFVAKFNGTDWMRRVGVSYAMLKTFRKDQQDADRFWAEVVSGENPLANSGSRALQRYLMTVTASTAGKIKTADGKRAGNGGGGDSWGIIAGVAVTCWNFWRTGKTISRLFKNKDIPPAV